MRHVRGNQRMQLSNQTGAGNGAYAMRCLWRRMWRSQVMLAIVY